METDEWLLTNTHFAVAVRPASRRVAASLELVSPLGSLAQELGQGDACTAEGTFEQPALVQPLGTEARQPVAHHAVSVEVDAVRTVHDVHVAVHTLRELGAVPVQPVYTRRHAPARRH